MKPVVLSLSILSALLSGGAFADTPVIVPREPAQQHTQQLLNALSALLQQLGQSAVMRAVPEGQQAIATVAGLLNPVRELERMLSSAPMVTPQGAVPVPQQVVVQVQAPPPPPVVEAPPAPPPGPTAIAGPDLARIMAAVRAESFGRDQLAVLQSAIGENYFTIAQSKEVMQLFTFSGERLSALGLMAPRILDKQNAFELNSFFTFSSEKRKARALLGR